MYTISELYSYPIKSMGGISLEKAVISETGLAWDRHWMLVDSNGNGLTQRDLPQMTLFKPEFTKGGIKVHFKGESIQIPKERATSSPEIIIGRIWQDKVLLAKEDKAISSWFSQRLNRPVFLVRMAPEATRPVKNHAPATVHFPDSSPYLVVGEASLQQLNKRLDSPVHMDRFRPNIVFSGGLPHEEDHWTSFAIGQTTFKSVKPCARCRVTTIDQNTSKIGEEPLTTLSQYRLIDRKILFGYYFKALETQGHTLAVGDRIHLG